MNLSDVDLRETNQTPMPRSTDEKGGIQYDNVFSRIEELIKGNTFSSEEIRHLVEILGSRENNEWEKRKSIADARLDAQLVLRTPEIRRPTSNEKQHNIERATIGVSGVKFNASIGVSASSPIDIARAYMAVRTSEGSHAIYNTTSKGERDQRINESARNSLLPSPSPKPSIRWPGAMVHDRHGYATPQSQRDRNRFHDFPRTPYSRTTLSKSKTKLQTVGGYENTSTPFQLPQTSSYGQVKSKRDNIDGYGSVGPIRRIRNKFSSEVRPRGSIFGPPKGNPSKTVESATRHFLPSTGRSLEHVEKSGTSKYLSAYTIPDSSDKGIPNPNLSPTHAVRKILEHLDRTKPTPKEKEAELKLATAWRTSSPENISSVASHKNTAIASANIHVGNNQSSSKSKFLQNLQDEVMKEATNADNGNAKASSPSKNNGNKPSLPPISTNKPDFRAVSSENGFGFTFPVSASSGVFSEPPTPSIAPSSSPSAVSQPIGLTATPNYVFGAEKSTPPLVFSFPSTSGTPAQDDSALKFSFGSDDKARLSFGSFAKDAVCY